MKSCRLRAFSCQVTQKLKRATAFNKPTVSAIFYTVCYQLAFILLQSISYQFCSLPCVWVDKLFGWFWSCFGFFERPANVLDKLMNSEPYFIDSTVTRTETIYIYDFKGDRLIVTRNNTITYEKRLTFTYGLKKRSNDYVKTLYVNEEPLNRIINYNCELKNRNHVKN